ncbi:MAG: nucleotide exchange factor GrpE [Candidatus Thorarchaeota archaeon]|nr:MAG: nucleotide exchange factor GrpE [Candidatus Thorarchaeota archaeon]
MSEKENENHETDIDMSDEGLDSEEAIEIIPENPDERNFAKECQRSKDLFDRLQRLQAEFDNYRKLMEMRFSEATKFASEGILLKMLDVYDNLLRALQIDFRKDTKGAEAGIRAIRQQMDKILADEGVRPIKSVGLPFDPYYQHSAGTRNDPKVPDGVVAEEYQSGYMLREKVLRPAIVCVNRHEAPDNDATESKSEKTHKDSEV